MITLQEMPDFVTEKRFVEDGKCTFAVVDRSPVLFVSTKLEDIHSGICELPGYELVLNCGPNMIKRFVVKASKEVLTEKMRTIFGSENVAWINSKK